MTDQVIGAAIEVHRHLGPGLLESAYEECLCHEMTLRKLNFERQKSLPLEYKGVRLDCGYRMDVVVEGKAIIEIKCVDKLAPIHQAQLLTYMKLADIEIGLLFNFHVPRLMDGFKRLILQS